MFWPKNPFSVTGFLDMVFNSEAKDMRNEMESIIKETQAFRESVEDEYTNNYANAKSQLEKLEYVKLNAWQGVLSVFVDKIKEIKNINLRGYDKIPFVETNMIKNIQSADFKKTEITLKEKISINMFDNLFRINTASSFFSMLNAEENLQKAKEYAAKANYETEKIKTRSVLLYRLGELVATYSSFIDLYAQSCVEATSQLVIILNNAKEEQSKSVINKIKKYFNITWKINFNDINERDQQIMQIIYLMNQILYKVIQQPLITPEGEIVNNADKQLEDARKAAKMLPPT